MPIYLVSRKEPRVKTVEFTISVKRSHKGSGTDIVGLISAIPDAVVLGGESGYAVDVAIPADREAQLRALVQDTCTIEEAHEFSFLNGAGS